MLLLSRRIPFLSAGTAIGGVLCVVIAVFLVVTGPVRAAAPGGGHLDPSFGIGGRVSADFGGFEQAAQLLIQPDGKIVAIGFTSVSLGLGVSRNRLTLVRYRPDGRLDAGFGSGGQVTTTFPEQQQSNVIGAGPHFSLSAALAPDGSIVVVSYYSEMTKDTNIYVGHVMARYRPDGSLDPTFGQGGKQLLSYGHLGNEESLQVPTGIAVQADGKIVVHKTVRGPRAFLVRYNSNGSPDLTFGSQGVTATTFPASSVTPRILVQADGQLVVGSSFNGGNFLDGDVDTTKPPECAVARFSPEGAADSSFGSGGVAVLKECFGTADIALQSDGKILLAAAGNVGDGDQTVVGLFLFRLDTRGQPDTSFGAGGRAAVGASGRLATLPDDRIVVGFGRETDGSTPDPFVQRFSPRGVLDTGFGDRGKAPITGAGFQTPADLAVQPDGNIVTLSHEDTTPNDQLADTDLVLRRLLNGPSAVHAIQPTSFLTSTTVMQGGTAYRHLRLVDPDSGAPVPNRQLAFTTVESVPGGGPATTPGEPILTDASGNFTYTVKADTLGGVGSYRIRIEATGAGGGPIGNGPLGTFGVEVGPREYSHSWNYGSLRRAQAGVSEGLIAYARGAVSSGSGLTLQETSARTPTDDVVEVKQVQSAEVGGGVGLGNEVGLTLGSKTEIVKITSELAKVDLALRGFSESKARFAQPYSADQRQAQGVALLVGLLDAMDALPLVTAAIDASAAQQLKTIYRTYVTADAVGLAVAGTPRGPRVSFDSDLAFKAPPAGGPDHQQVGFTLVDVGGTVVSAGTLTSYPNEWSLSFQLESGVDISVAQANIPGFDSRLASFHANRLDRYQKEYFFTKGSNQFRRAEFTLASAGNSVYQTDVQKNQVATKVTIPAEKFKYLGNNFQADWVLFGTELKQAFTDAAELPYETTVEDGWKVSLVPELSFSLAVQLSLGAGLEVEGGRSHVTERGVISGTRTYLLETYQPDFYLDHQEKGFVELANNALSGLWEPVQSAFATSAVRLNEFAETALELNLFEVGVPRGGAQLRFPAGARVQRAAGLTIQASEGVTVTGVGWAPQPAAEGTVPAPQGAASGRGFVVGGLYNFQPETLSISPAAALVVSYTDATLGTLDESKLGLFRWNAPSANWQPVAAQADAPTNRFSASIDRLGTYAVGLDVLPPTIGFGSPASGGTVTGTLALQSLVRDAGVGVDPASVQVRLDGQPIAATYITKTGEIEDLVGPVAPGPHTLVVSAADTAGNAASGSVTFTATEVLTATVPGSRVYLPALLRGSNAGW